MPEKNDVKIFVFHYKPGKIIADSSEYIHILAGNNGTEQHEGFIGDDTGDHISQSNKYYSELTGLYWIWKNTKTDIVGSCHYRRYYTTSKFPLSHKLKMLIYYTVGLLKKRRGLIYTQNQKYWKSKIISNNEVIEIFKSFEAILPVRKEFKYSVEEHYRRYHNIEDLHRIEAILNKLYPEYIESFKTVLAGNTMFANNMFILKWERFDELMEWLFSILFKFEEEINLEDYKNYQERILGFLSERLITVWIHHNKIKYRELSLIYFKKLKTQLNA